MLIPVPPKPPKPVDVPAVAVLLPNRPPPELVFVPKPDVLPPNGLDVEPVAPKPRFRPTSECAPIWMTLKLEG